MAYSSQDEVIVLSVDNVVDAYHVSGKRPEQLTVNSMQYQALLKKHNLGRQHPIMQLTHYRGIPIQRI